MTETDLLRAALADWCEHCMPTISGEELMCIDYRNEVESRLRWSDGVVETRRRSLSYEQSDRSLHADTVAGLAVKRRADIRKAGGVPA